MEQLILAIIPARGGSKGVPQKNIRLLNGKPLIAWTIEQALQSRSLNRLIVSTDDTSIAQISLDYGAEVPFLRPVELAQDDTPDLPVYLHAVSWLAEHQGYHPDIVAWLRPTAPLRTADDVDGAVRLLLKTGADCVRSVCEAEHHPYWMKRFDGNRLLPFLKEVDERKYFRRQTLPPVYRLNGAVDVTRRRNVIGTGELYGGNMGGYVMPSERSIDLDREVDFTLATLLLESRAS